MLVNRRAFQKIFVYVGAFSSQAAVFYSVLMVVRNSNSNQIADFALIDAALLFLPFLISFMSERTAVVLCQDTSTGVNLEVFKSSLYFTVLLTPIVYLAYWLLADIAGFLFGTSLDYYILCAALSIAVYNITIQKILIQSRYTLLAGIQICRALVVISLMWLGVRESGDMLILFLVVHIVSNFVAFAVGFMASGRSHLTGFKLTAHAKDWRLFATLGLIPLSVFLAGYVVGNIGRLALKSYGLTEQLAVLLIYSKILVVMLATLMPMSMYLKPRILEFFRENINTVPREWSYLLVLATAVASAFLLNFDLIWGVWGYEGMEPSNSIAAVLFSGGVAGWLTTTVVELKFERRSLLILKLVIFGVPMGMLVSFYAVMSSGITLSLVIYSGAIAECLILAFACFHSFKDKAVNALIKYLTAVVCILSVAAISDVIGRYVENHAVSISINVIATVTMLSIVAFMLFSKKIDL